MSPLFLQTAAPSRVEQIGRFLETFWPILVPVLLGLAAVYLLLPRARRYPPLWGGVAAGLALATGGWLLIRTETALPETVLFYSFSGLAIGAGGLLITLRNPVHAALSFALVVLSTCGLFLLQAAPFLMAATIVIYAGAIVVTFLFVIMLAQQEGPSSADQRSREPFLATVAGFILLGALLCVLHRTYDTSPLDDVLAQAKQALDDAAQAPKEKKAEAIEKALGGFKSYRDRFTKLLPPESAAQTTVERPRLINERANLRRTLAQTFDHLLFDPEVPGAKPPQVDVAKLTANLQTIYQAGQRLRQAHGSLLPEEKLPLSPFSGVRPSTDMPPPDQYGKPKERMPANNVSALGRSLFSDYLLAVELGGVLLLVATIGAIAIAGRGKEGLR